MIEAQPMTLTEIVSDYPNKEEDNLGHFENPLLHHDKPQNDAHHTVEVPTDHPQQPRPPKIAQRLKIVHKKRL